MLDALGLDADDVEWHHFSVCVGQSVSRFYERYESDPRIAKTTDQMCLSCPVQKECLQAAIANNEWGCWGGIYLVNGRPDDARNAHKTQDIWDEIRSNVS